MWVNMISDSLAFLCILIGSGNEEEASPSGVRKSPRARKSKRFSDEYVLESDRQVKDSPRKEGQGSQPQEVTAEAPGNDG